MGTLLWKGVNALIRREDDPSSSSDTTEDSNPSTGNAAGDQILNLVANPFKQSVCLEP